MLLYSRRFTIWLMSFLAVLVVYFIYNRLSRTPLIPTDIMTTPAGQLADVCDSIVSVGKVGGVGVGLIKNSRYTTLNAQKKVEREFGFEELLHQDGNNWEIKKPYMNIYRRSFNCSITGERANVAVEMAGGRVTPRQGMLMGNVIIRILPKQKDAVGETTIYLDDIAFSADKSLFSTAGPIEIVSENMRMTGTGVEIIYNGDDERLERLQITNLQSLRIKKWSQGSVLRSTPDANANNQKGESAQAPKRGKYYQCTLDKNVRIETPTERLFADALSINDIFAQDSSAEQDANKSSPDRGLRPDSGKQQTAGSHFGGITERYHNKLRRRHYCYPDGHISREEIAQTANHLCRNYRPAGCQRLARRQNHLQGRKRCLQRDNRRGSRNRAFNRCV